MNLIKWVQTYVEKRNYVEYFIYHFLNKNDNSHIVQVLFSDEMFGLIMICMLLISSIDCAEKQSAFVQFLVSTQENICRSIHSDKDGLWS